MITIQEFKKQVKQLALEFNISKKDISITTSRCNWVNVFIYNLGGENYTNLKRKIEKLAGFVNNSDSQSDYFEYKTQILNKYNSTFESILISSN